MYMILNVAVGGEWGGQKGVDTSVFPQTMEIDWVRVSKVATSPGPFSVQARASQGGHVEVLPSKSSYDPLEKMVLHAVADSGWAFSSWDSGSSSRTEIDTVLVERDLVARAVFLPAGEQIANGDFSSGLAGWTHWNDEALASSWTTRDGMACIRPGGRDSANSWKAQFDWSGLAVTTNEQYELSFLAKSSVPRKVSIGIVQDYAPNGGLSGGWTQALTPNLTRFNHTFKITKSGAPARLEFDIAADTAEICLDSVSLRKIKGQTSVAPRSALSIALDVHREGRAFVIRSTELPLASWEILRRDGSVVRAGRFDASGMAQIEGLPKGILLFSATARDGSVAQRSLLVM